MPTPTSPDPQPDPQLSLADTLAALSQGRVRPLDLTAFSDLSRADMAAVAKAWPELPLATRESAMREIERLIEDHVEYFFGRFLRVVLDDPSPVVRQLAIEGLWEDEGADLPDLFAAILPSDGSVDVRAAAAAALAPFVDQVVLDEIDEETSSRIQSALAHALTNPAESDFVRRRALESLAGFGNTSRMREEIRAAYDDDEDLLRIAAIVAMGRTTDSEWLETVIAEFENDSPEFRYESAQAAGLIGDDDAVVGLVSLGSDEDSSVRQASILALGRIGGSIALNGLRRLQGIASEAEQELIDAAMEEAQGYGRMG